VLIQVFIALILLPTTGYAQNDILTKKVTISFQNSTIPSALKQLEKDVNRSFSYNSSQVDKNKKITKSYNQATVRNILDDLLGHRIADIRVSAEKISFHLKEVATWRGKLTGRVIDATGLPLPDITVTLKPLNKKVKTNSDGQYSFDYKGIKYIELENIPQKAENVMLWLPSTEDSFPDIIQFMKDYKIK